MNANPSQHALPGSPLICAVALLMCLVAPVGADTKAWVEQVQLPTYKVAPPDPSPRFYAGRTYQGAKATFYPYPVWDQMTDQKEVVSYKSLNLENEYVKLSVLPELGGRIFTATDKGNGYDFFYRQHVIKPALIGMLGAWISGGVEWNIPHHHRASSFMPVDHAIVEESDGGKTIWVGETELRHRLRWLVGITLRPGKSYVEMTVKVFNRTPAAQSFLFWINPAVHANENYQVLFPPSVQWAVQHAKPEFASWPMAKQVYGGVDYSKGVDISWWKNHPSPVSLFAWDCQEDFFGGYDHGRKAGVVQVSNHHVSPGKKFFEWGNGPEGEMWSKILSDDDGPYLELMAGSYSDNQPDYSWCQPHEVKVFKHYWYPVRELGGLKNANTEGAVNLQLDASHAEISFNTTAAHKDAKVLVEAGGQSLLKEVVAISPAKPFRARVELPAGTQASGLKASLYTSSGKEIVSYQEVSRTNSAKPKPVSRPRTPSEIESSEELLLTGLRIEQLYSPAYDATLYYKEALKRDAGDYRANVALGSLYCRQGRYNDAEALLRKAVARATDDYIRSKDCEALYYLGITLKQRGDLAAARDMLYRSIWDRAWQAPGYYALAEIAAHSKDYKQALQLVEQSLDASALDTKALELKATLLRHLGRSKEAARVAKSVLELDPLNGRAVLEENLADGANARKLSKELGKQLRNSWASHIEVAMDYANTGFYDEAGQVLEALNPQGNPEGAMALARYYQGYFLHQNGKAAEALETYKTAARMGTDFGFPFQHEAESVLKDAIAMQPADAHARYFLGNLLFDSQPERASKLWEEALALEPEMAMAQRNLALSKARSKSELPAALSGMEKALALAPDNARMYYEMDVIYEAAGAAVEKRLASFERNLTASNQRDDALSRRIQLLTASGKPEEALQLLGDRQFHNWEGSSSLHDIYVDACLQNGMKQLRDGKAQDALKSMQAAREYPANQQVGKPKHERRGSEIAFWTGAALEAAGDKEGAKREFEQAAGEGARSEADFYKAMAARKLGKGAEAEAMLKELQNRAEQELAREQEDVDYFAKFGERRAERLRKAEAHYLAGIAAKGAGNAAAAEQHFTTALELDPGQAWSRIMRATKFD